MFIMDYNVCMYIYIDIYIYIFIGPHISIFGSAYKATYIAGGKPAEVMKKSWRRILWGQHRTVTRTSLQWLGLCIAHQSWHPAVKGGAVPCCRGDHPKFTGLVLWAGITPGCILGQAWFQLSRSNWHRICQGVLNAQSLSLLWQNPRHWMKNFST